MDKAAAPAQQEIIDKQVLDSYLQNLTASLVVQGLQTLFAMQKGNIKDQTKSSLQKVTNTLINPNYKDLSHFWQTCTQANSFKDKEFPPQKSSLTVNPPDFPVAEKVVWKRVKEFMDPLQIKVFAGEIEPCDIFQGSLGDCYFLSALCTLAEHPSLISRIFETREYNPLGFYSVWLNHDGIWKNIVVDDYFPCIGKVPCFSKANGPELWVMILEKAYSKIFGCYHNIKQGYPELSVTDLTGSPSDRCQTDKEADAWAFIFNKVEEEKRDPEIKYIFNSVSNEDKSKQIEVKDVTGVISSHVYSVLDAKEVKTKNGIEKIIQLRNPWGKGEWTGDWSDSSDKWTPELIKLCKLTKQNDGIFWINISDFCKKYTQISCNYLHLTYQYNATKLDFANKGEFAIVQLQVPTSGAKGYIQYHQKDKRNFKHLGVQYKYSRIRTMIFSGTPQNIGAYIGEGNSNLRSGYTKVDLSTGGKYFVVVHPEWTCNISREIVISCYVSNQIYFQGDAIYPRDDAFLDNCFLKIPPKNQNDVYIYREDNAAFRYTNSNFGYYYLNYINESPSSSFTESVTMGNLKHLQISLPYHDSSKYEISLKPKEKKVVKYKILPTGNGAFSKDMKSTNRFHVTSQTIIQRILKNQSNLKVRKSDSKQQPLNFYCLYHSEGVALYYENKTDQAYSEQISLTLSNLHSEEDLDTSKAVEVQVPPKYGKLLKFQTIDFSKAPTLKYTWVGKFL